MALPLGATVAKLKAIAIKPVTTGPIKKRTKGAREFRVNLIPSPWKFTPTAAATTYAARVAELKTALAQDLRFDPNHVWPKFKRAGYSSLDEYMDGHQWNFGPKNDGPIATGVRFEYTVVLPITDNSGPKPKLFYNFYPGTGYGAGGDHDRDPADRSRPVLPAGLSRGRRRRPRSHRGRARSSAPAARRGDAARPTRCRRSCSTAGVGHHAGGGTGRRRARGRLDRLRARRGR